MNVNIKSAAGKKNRVTTVKIPFDENISTAEELIEGAVSYCVDEYNARRESSELLKILSPEAIGDMASVGKVSFGINYGTKDADKEKAIADAKEAFADGIVVIFADKSKLESLETSVNLSTTGELTFIKLVMLAGRMW